MLRLVTHSALTPIFWWFRPIASQCTSFPFLHRSTSHATRMPLFCYRHAYLSPEQIDTMHLCLYVRCFDLHVDLDVLPVRGPGRPTSVSKRTPRHERRRCDVR
mmetsp:Transcript_6806/g.24208  ORF Transcript_6806/g.24208 Transcript_6806/m.24208 type:complete len:103 (+) Transcript_6806:853-1161(+)